MEIFKKLFGKKETVRDQLMPRPFADGAMTATSAKHGGQIMIKKECVKVLVNGLDKVLDKEPMKKIITPGTMKEGL